MSETTIELDTTKWDALLQRLANNVKRSQKILRVAAQAFAFQDIIDHFKNEESPDGRWKAWAEPTRRIYEKLGWLGNKILQAKGYLRQSLMPGRGKIANHGTDGLRLFTNMEYSGIHNYGGPFRAFGKYPATMPKREFMWLSEGAKQKMVDMVAQLIIENSGAA
jgi:phage gpG-like protein